MDTNLLHEVWKKHEHFRTIIVIIAENLQKWMREKYCAYNLRDKGASQRWSLEETAKYNTLLKYFPINYS